MRSPFVDKDSQEQFEIRTPQAVDRRAGAERPHDRSLMRLNLPAGVDIEIKL
jgi:small subunit ribosomal protein S10